MPGRYLPKDMDGIRAWKPTDSHMDAALNGNDSHDSKEI